MTDKQTEALKLARQLISNLRTHSWTTSDEQFVLKAIDEALAEQPAQQECNHCGGTGDVSGEYPGVACPDCSGSGVQVKPEFFTHSVEQPYDWSDWVCPDPKSYLMKCCDCGLVHEAQFGVVRYKSEAEREGCDMVDDPNLQAVFRMRRSEQWSPEDTAHRAGGLPMEQPAQPKERADYAKGFVDGFAECVKQTQPAQQQEPVAWMDGYRNIYSLEEKAAGCPEATIALVPMANHKKTSGSPINELQCVCGAVWLGEEMVHLPDKRPPASKPWVGLTDEEKMGICERLNAYNDDLIDAIEAKLREKNT